MPRPGDRRRRSLPVTDKNPPPDTWPGWDYEHLEASRSQSGSTRPQPSPGPASSGAEADEIVETAANWLERWWSIPEVPAGDWRFQECRFFRRRANWRRPQVLSSHLWWKEAV